MTVFPSVCIPAQLTMALLLSWLHFPVSGISFLGPCFSFLSRIPQDSCGFLFFPEEFFYRNLLLAGRRNPELLRNHRNTPEFLFPPTKTTVIWSETMASERRWKLVGSYHGLWWTDALDPAHRRNPDITGDAAMCWVEGIRPPQPERFHYFGGDFLYAYITRKINNKLNFYITLYYLSAHYTTLN